MVKKIAKVIVEGESVIDDRIIARFFASIDASDPKDINLSTRQIDKVACKEKRVELRADEAEFEDYVYSIQDNLIAAINN